MERVLKGASIILAGATGGLGSAIGARLEKEGARLVLFGRDAGRLAALGLTGERVAADFAEHDACELAVDAALKHYGRLDGVINAAGVVAFGEARTLTDAVMNELLLANLVGPIRLVRAALPHLQKGGFIANLSAVVAEHPTAGMAFYSATKAALSAFDAALARELRRAGVDVIDIRPPHTETGLASRPIAGESPRLSKGLRPDAVAEKIVESIHAGVREVAAGDFAQRAD